MIARTTKENAPVERGGFSAATTQHEGNHSAIADDYKVFSTFQAKFATAGHTLYRTVNADGTILYLAGKWGYCRELKSIEAVAAFLVLIGGRV
jgi:hypothetical protein